MEPLLENRLDPIKQGSQIINDLIAEFGSEGIHDLVTLDRFLKKLITETRGLVILDMLDSRNWDCIGSYEIDYNMGYVTLNWHYYTEEPVISHFISNSYYKPSIMSATLHFKDLQFLNIRDSPCIFMRGYAIHENEVLKYYRSIDKNVKFCKEEKLNFCLQFEIDKGDHIVECQCFNTPIYSIIILPKDFGAGTSTTQKLLFVHNYSSCSKRLMKIYKSFSQSDLDEDILCEKANTIRRVFEFVLKIQCCYEAEFDDSWLAGNENDFLFKQNYGDLTLGSLVKILRSSTTEEQKSQLNKIVRLSNELSHDSGKPITKQKVVELYNMTESYLIDLIKKVP